ncbi:type II toxin-antitoxin system HicA family toxin [Candidatus Uhrbacteria bacterium]|nr:type II toxin-antitoxin system HicA family toxin [Candidatus Uhrbacteria bacterium]
MPSPISARRVIRILQERGFFFVSQKGSHAKFRKGSCTVIVPLHGKEIPYGTFRSIVRQSHLQESDFRS